MTFRADGFTLVELVMVIVVLGILSLGSVKFVSQSAQGLVDTADRQILSSAANIALEKVLREVRRALPNSVRTFSDGANTCLEITPINSSSEYISIPTASNALSFDAVQFSTHGVLTSGYVAVYPTSVGAVYGTSPATVRAVSDITASAGSVGVSGPSLQTITFSAAPGYRFPTESPRKRFFLVGLPVSFCDDGNGHLWRYKNYGFQVNSSASIPTSGGDRELIADSLRANSLSFNVIPAQLNRNAVVSMSLVVERQGSPEQLSVSQEVQLRNVP